MALTPAEKLQRRASDPYYGLAERQSVPSLAMQKSASLAAAKVEKDRALDPAAALADEAIAMDNSNLIDVAQSSVYQTVENMKDFFTGGQRTNEEIKAQADIDAGVSDRLNQELAGEQQAVVESLAGMLHSADQGNYLDAIGQGLTAAGQSAVAAPGVLAQSANVVPEIAAGALTANVGGRAIFARRAKKAKEGTKKFFERVDEARDNLAKNADTLNIDNIAVRAIEGVPKAAVQMSMVNLNLTQRQNNDFRAEHGRDMNREEFATSYALNLATTLPTPSILKNLFLPDFKKQLKKEVGTLTKNIKSGSNFKQIMRRVGDGTKKITLAAGAEAGQEYFQTWAESINVQLGPKERENFWKSMLEVFGNEDNQLQALAGAFLGGGAGGTARLAITAPAVAGGATLDTAKGTAKVAAKTAIGTTKLAAKGVKRVVDAGAYKVLSQSERDVILSEHASRKEIVDNRVSELQTSINTVKSATTIDELRENAEIRKVVDAAIGDQDPSDFDTRRKVEGLKADIISAYRGDIGLLKTELSLRTGTNFARKAAQNVGTATKSATVATMEAVDPGVKAVVDSVEKYGPKAVQAVKELRSSTARGMIEIAFNAGKAETKSILEAAKSLDLDDLQRTMATISEFNPQLAQQLKTVSEKKKRALKGAGSIINKVVNVDNLSKAITKAAELTNITADKVASISSSVNTALASTIEDIESLEKIEAVVDLIEKTDEFKKGIKGAMSRDAMVVARRDLAKARTRLEKEAAKAGRSTGEKVVDTAAAAAAKAKPVVDKAVDSVRTKLDNVQESLEKSAKDKARESFKVSPTFTAVMEAVIDTLKDPKKADALADSAPDLVKQMRKAGIETRADFEVFVEEFPEININMEFYDQLTAAYPTNIALDEAVDVFQNKLVNTAKGLKKAFNKLTKKECHVK